MKLIRFGEPGKEKPGVIFPDGSMRDVSNFTKDFNESFFENDGISQLQKWIEENIPFGIFEYGGKHFRTGSWVA